MAIGWFLAPMKPKLPPLWQPDHAYAVGDRIRIASTIKYGYFCMQAGTSLLFQPNFTEAHKAVTADNDVLWKCWRLTSTRYCAVNDYLSLIRADGGLFSEAECLGNHAVVKVRATAATLATIAADPDITRLPKVLLTETFADMTNAQKQAIIDKCLALGFTLQQIRARLGSNLAQMSDKTLRELLVLLVSRWRRVTYKKATDAYEADAADWSAGAPKSIDTVQAEVS